MRGSAMPCCSGASTSGRPACPLSRNALVVGSRLPVPYTLGGSSSKRLSCASAARASSSDSAQDMPARLAREAQEAASRFTDNVRAWTIEQNLDQKAKETVQYASSKARETYDELQGKARRKFVALDSEFEITNKAARAVREAQYAAKDFDQTYNVKRRLKSSMEYTRRMWPTWQKQLNEFAGTWWGKATIFLGIVGIVSTSAFWKVVHLGLLLWWLSVPIGMMALTYAQKKAQEQRDQQSAEEQRAQRPQNPFADMFRSRATATAQRPGPVYDRGSRSKHTQQYGGPIIEAEWTTLDEGDMPKKKNGKR